MSKVAGTPFKIYDENTPNFMVKSALKSQHKKNKGIGSSSKKLLKFNNALTPKEASKSGKGLNFVTKTQSNKYLQLVDFAKYKIYTYIITFFILYLGKFCKIFRILQVFTTLRRLTSKQRQKEFCLNQISVEVIVKNY